MTKTVLIVDDEPSNIDLLKGILPSTLKIKATIAGDKALKLINRQCPDLVFLDLMMPIMDGYQTLAAIKSDHPELPVVIVSGNASAQDQQKSRELGAFAHLQKPVSSAELEPLLAQVLAD